MRRTRAFGIVNVTVIVMTLILSAGVCWLSQLNDVHSEDVSYSISRQQPVVVGYHSKGTK
jgi:hypothetical protein